MGDEFPSLYTPSASAGASTSTSMTGLTAAQALEQMHGQAEATSNNGAGASEGSRRSQLDLSSESAFPSLGTPFKATASGGGGGWGSMARSRAAAPAPTQAATPLYTETLVLPSSSINVASLPTPSSNSRTTSAGNDATTLGGVINHIMTRYPSVKIEASSSTFKQTTTFLFKALRQQDVERVKNELKARIVRKVTETVQVPASTRAFIIGAKGRTLNTIIDETGVSIQIPKDSGVSVALPESDEPEYEQDEPDDPLILITLHGDGSSVSQAKQRILAIVNERTSRLSTKVSSIPEELYHLLSAKVAKNELLSENDAENVSISIPPVWKVRSGTARGVSANTAEDTSIAKDVKDNAILVSGEREAVTRAVEALTAAADELARTTQTISMSLSKRQHRFILPPVSDQILLATSCSVEVPPSSISSDQITIRGPSSQLVEALQMVMQKANAASVDIVDLGNLHGIETPPNYAKQCARYLLNKAKLRQIADEESVQIFIPRPGDPHTTIDIVATQGPRGPAAAVAAARVKVLEVLKALPPSAFDTVEIDQLLHRFLIGRKGARIQAFEEKNSVQVIFPPASTGDGEDKQVTLVYIGSDQSAAATVLLEVKNEIARIAKDAADFSTSTLTVSGKLHKSIIGPGGTTLNALIGTGDDRIVSVRFGSSNNSIKGAVIGEAAMNEDDIVVRGPGDEVKRVVREIERIAEEAKNDEIINSYIAEFDIEQRFVSHIVGKGGSGIQKLRDELGVKIDFGDEMAPAVSSNEGITKAKKSGSSKPSARSHVKIQGRTENVEEAKKKILRQTESLADETTLMVPMLAGLDRGSLIGKQGSYVQRLESKYEVRINIPRANEDGEKDDVVTIRGGKKGADSARKELIELMEYDREHNQSTTLSVPARALPRIFGRQGATIRELKEETKAEIDVGKGESSNTNGFSTLTFKGTKQAIAAAKKAISAIVADVEDESTFEIRIERPLHVSIIGKGGQTIRELIIRCGGPSDAKASGGLVRFPRNGEEPSDLVIVRGPSALASKIKTELENQTSALRDRIVYGVVVPQTFHARLIGRGGAGVNELQRKHDVKIVLPSWKEAGGSGDVINKADLGDFPESDLIKLLGSRNACEAAAAEITQKAGSRPSSGHASQQQQQSHHQQQRNQAQSADQLIRTVMIPSRLHLRVTQGGKFFRHLPSGIRIDHGDIKTPTVNRATGPTPSSSSPSSSSLPSSKVNGGSTPMITAARIDEDSEDPDFRWEITPLGGGGQGNGDNDDSEDVGIPWNIRGNDQAKVDRVEAMVMSALEKSQSETHQGILTVPQSLIPRIVGRGGSGLDKLRALGVSAEVEGRQGANSVIFMGNPDNLEKARQAVMDLHQSQRSI